MLLFSQNSYDFTSPQCIVGLGMFSAITTIYTKALTQSMWLQWTIHGSVMFWICYHHLSRYVMKAMLIFFYLITPICCYLHLLFSVPLGILCVLKLLICHFLFLYCFEKCKWLQWYLACRTCMEIGHICLEAVVFTSCPDRNKIYVRAIVMNALCVYNSEYTTIKSVRELYY